MAKIQSEVHRWRFFRAGGVDQVRLDTGSDIVHLEDLDQKLWVALSCPVKGLEFDEKTLALIDADHDGRVRAQELIDAVNWIAPLIKNPDDLTRGDSALPLRAIDDGNAEGKRLLAAARHILAGLGKKEAAAISVEDAMRTSEMLKQTRFNGDGILPPESVEEASAKQVAAEIVACLGGEMDRSGLAGISQAKLDQFFTELAAYDAWWRDAEAGRETILPLGEATVSAVDSLRAVRAKIDDYFARCRLAEFDERALAAVNRREEEYLALTACDMSITADELRGFPLARVAAKKPLPLDGGLNPAWAGALKRFRELAVAPVLGERQTTLGEADWARLQERFTAYDVWQSRKRGQPIESLGLARVRAILAGGERATLAELIAEDRSLEPEMNALGNVERLVRYYRDLHKLLSNYVSFIDFYSRRDRAIFQVGTLYLDGRSCELCVHVDDVGKHMTLAVMAKTYLVYCECSRPATNEKMQIAAAFTAGDSETLFVGRNGLFYDRKGKDWDATVTKVLENPISIGQAFLSPYKRLIRWIEEQAAKRAAAADEASTGKLTSAATSLGTAAETGKAPPAKPKFDIGIVAALGVAVGGIAAALSSFLNAIFGLGLWMPLGFVGLILLISGPSMIIAWLKLRQRNLGPLLDANGWAVNGRVKINIPLGAALTDTAALPPGSERSLKDPYAPKKRIWPKVLVFFILLGAATYGLYHYGYLQKWYEEIRQKIEDARQAAAEKLKPPAEKPAETPPAEKK